MKVIIVGRDASCDIEVNDVKVSRQHLQIVMNDAGQISAIDLNSTNGTWVNGNRIQGECKIGPNDNIKVGDTALPWQLIMQKLNGGAAMPQSPRPSSAPAGQAPKKGSNKKSNKTLVWIIILVAVILIGGGVAYYFMMESEKAEQKRIETQKNYINEYQEIVDEKAEAEAQAAKANEAKDNEMNDKIRAQKEAEAAKEAKAQADKEAEEAREAQVNAEQDAENARQAKNEAEKAKSEAIEAQAEADRLREEAEIAKQEAESIAKAQAQAQAQAQAETIAIMDETLDIKMDALNKKDLKAVAEALGLQEVSEKNAKEKIREAFNAANQAGDFDRMKQIYDSVKNGDQKSREAELTEQRNNLNNQYKEMIKQLDDYQWTIVRDSLNVVGDNTKAIKAQVTSKFNNAKDAKDNEEMSRIVSIIEYAKQQTAPEGENTEPEQEDEGNQNVNTGNMGGNAS